MADRKGSFRRWWVATILFSIIIAMPGIAFDHDDGGIDCTRVMVDCTVYPYHQCCGGMLPPLAEHVLPVWIVVKDHDSDMTLLPWRGSAR